MHNTAQNGKPVKLRTVKTKLLSCAVYIAQLSNKVSWHYNYKQTVSKISQEETQIIKTLAIRLIYRLQKQSYKTWK
jgi:hypothetical protein